MGFTPLEGVVMGTRSGSLDPGLVLHLLREEGASVDALDRVLHHDSGLRGLSGRSGDLREVLAAGDERAALALGVYVHRLRFHIGAMLGALGGLDAVVFTAGRGRARRGDPRGGARAVRVPRPAARRGRNAPPSPTATSPPPARRSARS